MLLKLGFKFNYLIKIVASSYYLEFTRQILSFRQ